VRKFLLAVLMLACSLTLLGKTQAQQAPAFTLTIHVTGFRNATGRLGAAIYSNANGWPEDLSKALVHDHTSIKNGEATIQFKLPAGTYSVAVLHDENGNQKLDRNIFGFPKEGFGFSNNVKAALSAPAWQKCSFTLDGDKTVEVALQYK